ncbi:MAG: hypothetical protein FWF27_04650, partial [Candidatus Bathyarchaeota archaeon]|nr:hypothetical protein [Candidatus Termiticorpusculum sp.]
MAKTKLYILRAKRKNENTPYPLHQKIKKLEIYCDGPIHSFTLTILDNKERELITTMVVPGEYIEMMQVNGKEILRGYVENVSVEASPTGTVKGRVCKVTGYCIARELRHKFLTYKWEKTQSCHIIEQALRLHINKKLATDHTPLPSILISGYNHTTETGIETNYDARDTYLIELCNELAEKSQMNYAVNFTQQYTTQDDITKETITFHQLSLWPNNKAPAIEVYRDEQHPNNNDLIPLLLHTPTLWTTPQRNTGNILEIHDFGSSIEPVYNSIKIKNGKIDDQFTEWNAKNWFIDDAIYTSHFPGYHVSIHDDNQVKIIGESSIRIDFHHIQQDKWFKCYVKLPPNYDYLDYSQTHIDHCSMWVCHNLDSLPLLPNGNRDPELFLNIEDTEGNVMHWRFSESIKTDGTLFVRGYDGKEIGRGWTKVNFQMGKNVDYVTNYPGIFHDKDSTGWMYDVKKTAVFSWKIVKMWFSTKLKQYHTKDGGGEGPLIDHAIGGSIWIDGLTFNSIEAFGIAYDVENIKQYGLRMLPISKPDLPKDFDALNQNAANELELQKHPPVHLKFKTTIQPNIQYCGLTVQVLAPHHRVYQGTWENPRPLTYRIENFTHVIAPGTDLYRGHDAYTELNLYLHIDPMTNKVIPTSKKNSGMLSNNQQASNVSFDNRLRRLEEYPNNSVGDTSGGTGSSASGGGGGGSSNWEGGIVSKEDVILESDWPILNEFNKEVEAWLWMNRQDQPQPKSFLRFVPTPHPPATTYETALDLYPVYLWNGDPNTDKGPTLCSSYNFMYRGDLAGRGTLKSYEGTLILHGGLNAKGRAYIAGNGNPDFLDPKIHRRSGWNPTWNPIIWLGDGGILHDKLPNGQKVPIDTDTLEIRVSGNYPEWGWGNLACGNLTVHGSMSALALIQAGDGTCGFNGTCTVWFDHKYTEAPIVTVSLKPGD